MPSFFHRCDVFETGYRVRLRGTGPSDLCPVDEVLEPALVTEVDAAARAHDFSKRPIATGFLGNNHVWCLASLGGSYRMVLVERSKYPRRVEALARRYHLTENETAHLRFAAGLTELAVVATRLGIGLEAADAHRALALERVRAASVTELARRVGQTSAEIDIRELGARMHAMLAAAPLRTS